MAERRLAPIILYAYNRLWHTKKTIDALKENELARESDLYIFSDASKISGHDENVDAVRELIKTVTGFKSVTIIERSENFGLAKNIISGVTDIVGKHGRVIVLEDDICTSPFFLKYMNDALDYYENEDQVVCIHGWMWPEEEAYPPFFLKGTDCWGWATWKKGWDIFESDGRKLLVELQKRKLCREFDMGGAYGYTQMLKDQIRKKNDSWAIRWHAATYLQNKLCLHPGVSLVENIGIDGTGTHSGQMNSYKTTLSHKSIDVAVSPIEESNFMLEKKAKFYESAKPGIAEMVIKKIIKLVKP